MTARREVLLTLPKSSYLPRLPSYQRPPSPVSPLESTLLQVLILNNLKSFRINTYKKHRGEGTPCLSICYTPGQRLPHFCLVASLRPYLLSPTLLNSEAETTKEPTMSEAAKPTA